MNQLIVPDTGVQLVDGSIVILSRFPGTKWIVHNGWYTYQGQQYMGWYFCSIPSQTIMPVSNTDLRLLTVVNDSGCGCNPGPVPTPPEPSCPCPPCPGPQPIPFTPKMAFQLDRAWISVDTIAQRDQLSDSKKLLPDGKIVRVNETPDGTPAYYRWSQVKQVWETETFGIDTSNFLTEAKANTLYASKESVSILQTQVKDLQDNLSQTVEDAVNEVLPNVIQNNSDVKSYIESTATTAGTSAANAAIDTKVPQMISTEVDKAVDDLTDTTIPDVVADQISKLNPNEWIDI